MNDTHHIAAYIPNLYLMLIEAYQGEKSLSGMYTIIAIERLVELDQFLNKQ